MRLQPENRHRTAHAGLYIHIPFCVRKCPYCAFYSTTDLGQVEAFVHGLTQEMDLVTTPVADFDSIYVGGGTPSLLKPSHIMHILEHARRRFSFAPDVEVTIEVNPGTLSSYSLRALLECGVNRVNIGIQSFDNRWLRFLGRLHSARQAREAIRLVREVGVENLGLDLMYGLADQGPKDWFRDLREATRYEPEHMSCYMLTYEEGTPFHEWREAGTLRPMNEDGVRGLFEDTVGLLEDGGYEHYEISNFARGPWFRSRHNQKYWCHAPYVGLGPSAHSFIEPRRWWNQRTLAGYLHAVQRGVLPVEGAEQLDQGQLMLESVFLGLRTSQGIELSEFRRRYGVDFQVRFGTVCERLEAHGLLAVSSHRCTLTMDGMMLADTISGMFAEQIGQ